MSDVTEFVRWLADPNRTQREALRIVGEQWRPLLAQLADDALLEALRELRRTINSKKLRAERDQLIGSLRRDGLEGGAPLPAPRAAPPDEPAPAPAPAGVPRELSEGRHPELEAAIAADPECRDGYLVYGDWLEARGDPRGQLVAIQAELGKRQGDRQLLRAEAELLEKEAARLLGPLAGCDDMLTEVEYLLGFIRSCRVQLSFERFNGDRVPAVSVEQVLEWLLDDPGPGRFLQQLTVGIVRHDDNTYQGVGERLAARPRPTLRRLFLGDFTYEETELNWSTIGDLSRLWAAVPGLQHLTLRSGSMTLGEISLPALRELTTITGGLDGDAARAIAAADWPELRLLSLQFGRPRYGATDDPEVVAPILEGQRLPRLRHLGLTNCEFTDALCAALPGAAILPRLEVLDLSMGTMSDEGAALLAGRRDALKHLKRLDVEDNYLSPEGLALLQGICAEVVGASQRSEDAGHRYAAAVE